MLNTMNHTSLPDPQGSFFAQYMEIDNLANFLLGLAWTSWREVRFLR